jgi:hypothetical protein
MICNIHRGKGSEVSRFEGEERLALEYYSIFFSKEYGGYSTKLKERNSVS